MKKVSQRLRLGALAIVLSALPACYRYVPLTTSPSAGEVVAFQITDQGRVGLSDRFGPGLARIEGLLTSTQDSLYLIDVYSIAQITGSSSQWSGESVRLPQSYVGSMQARMFDRGRTTTMAVVAAGAAGGTIGFLISRGLFGGYTPSGDSTVIPPPTKGRIPASRLPIRP